MEKELESRYKIYKLRDALEKLDAEYDRVYIDTPPNFNFYSKSALIAADSVLVPFDCDSFARQSLYSLMDNMAELQEDHNPDLEVEGIVINQFNSQARLPGELVAELEEEGYPVFRYLPEHLGEDERVPPGAPSADRYGPQPQADRAVPRSARGVGKDRGARCGIGLLAGGDNLPGPPDLARQNAIGPPGMLPRVAGRHRRPRISI